MTETTSNRWYETRSADRLHLLIAIVLLPLLIRLAIQEDLTWLAGVVLGLAVCVLTATRWPYGALFVVVGMSAMPVYFVELFGWKARPEHFAAAIVLVAVCARVLFKKMRWRFNQLDYWVLAFIVVNFLSSAVGSTSPSSTLRWALQNSLAVIPYFLIRAAIQDLGTLRKGFRILLAVAVMESAFGIFCYLSHFAFETTFGMSVGQYLVDVSASYGSMYEPNLFGAYAGCCAALCLAAFLLGQSRASSAAGFLVAALATLLSYSRAALIALIVASTWIFWKARRSKSADNRSKILAPILVLTFIFIIGLYAAGGTLQKRFEDLYYQGFTEGTALARLLVIQEAIMEIPGHVFLGNGTASFNLSFDWNRFIPEWASDKTWISNAPIRVLHDTGLIGLSLFLGFFFSASRRLRRIWKVLGAPDDLTLGLAGGLLLYAISFQFTDGTILAFFWVHLGFLASAVVIYQEQLTTVPVSEARG
jgi:hypothetical protein